MSCCQGRRFRELITLPSVQEVQKSVEEAATGAQKVGMAIAVGSVLAQVLFGKKTKAPRRRKARRTR